MIHETLGEIFIIYINSVILLLNPPWINIYFHKPLYFYYCVLNFQKFKNLEDLMY